MIALLGADTAAVAAQQVECDMDLGMVEYGNCLDRQMVVVDSELNRTYKATLATLTPDQQRALRAAERAWIRYRDTDSNFVETVTGGNHPSEMVEAQWIRVVRERITFLRTQSH